MRKIGEMREIELLLTAFRESQHNAEQFAESENALHQNKCAINIF